MVEGAFGIVAFIMGWLFDFEISDTQDWSFERQIETNSRI
jgi:hypothetical protein